MEYIIIVAAVLLVLILFMTYATIISAVFFKGKRYSDTCPHPMHGYYIDENKMVQFKSGKNTLNGCVYGENNKNGLVIIAHDIDVPSDYYIPEALFLKEEGFKVFLFDVTGFWKNDGKFGGMGQAVKDLKNAIEFMDDGTMPVSLIGHGMGGFAVCSISNFIDRKIANVISIEAPYSVAAYVKNRQNGFKGTVINIFQSIKYGKYHKKTAIDGINSAKKDTYFVIIHSKKDEKVSYDNLSITCKKDAIKCKNINFVNLGNETDSHSGVLRADNRRFKINEELFGYIVEILINE